MEEFKVENFEQETGKPFPNVRNLSIQEANNIRDRLIHLLKQSKDISTFDLVNIIDTNELYLKDLDASNNFSILKCLAFLNIDYKVKLFINWYHFDEIDEININDLENYFYDIWYQGSDDIDIFDASLNWILSIRHDGVVKYWQCA